MSPRIYPPSPKDALIAELIGQCQHAPGVGCKDRGRKRGGPWCVQCRAAQTIANQHACLTEARQTIRRLNRRTQVIEAAAGAQAYSERARRLCRYLHAQIEELRAEVLQARRADYCREQRDRELSEEYRREQVAEAARRVGLGGVYFLKAGPFVKVGISQNVRTRASHLQTTHNIEPLGFIPCEQGDPARKMEREIHDLLSEHRHHGEWFVDCDAVRAFIQNHAQQWPERVTA